MLPPAVSKLHKCREWGGTVRKFHRHPCPVYMRMARHGLFSPPSPRCSEEHLPLTPTLAFSFGNKGFPFVPARAINVRL